MSIAYSRGKIIFEPKHGNQTKEYPERSLIELRESSDEYVLRGQEMDKKEIIFLIPLTNRNQYHFGSDAESPDEIKTKDGTYIITLDAAQRDNFHTILHNLLDTLVTPDGQQPISPLLPKEEDNKLLVKIRKLNECIQNGKGDDAAKIAEDLAKRAVHLTSKPWKLHSEQEIAIQIQFDGNEYPLQKNGGNIQYFVYPSTTIRELRAVFEELHPIQDQYWFVNGGLAYDNATMTDLNVGPNSLLILFVVTQPKVFNNNEPWKCQQCRRNNLGNEMRCISCHASRQE